jgi:serine/threonine-protein kinase
MIEVRLDTQGRLLLLTAVPVQEPDAEEPALDEPDWAPLFSAAGFDRQGFRSVDPAWVPPVYADQRAAWEGVYPGAPETSIRIEAAAYRNRPVYFRVVEPWDRPPGTTARGRNFLLRARDVLYTIWWIVVLVIAGLLALRNVRHGRGDHRTALRFALYMGAMRLLCLLGAHHLPSSAEVDLFNGFLALALYRFGLVYVFYMALEPYARRLWPHMLVSWVRLLGGRFKDPLIGRDLLIGSLCGACMGLIISVRQWVPEILELPSYGLNWGFWSLESIRGLPQALGAIASLHGWALFYIFTGIMMLLVLRLLLRRDWIAMVVFSVLVVVLYNPGTGHLLPYLISMLFILPLLWFVLLRFGLLPLMLGYTVSHLLRFMPLTFDLSHWYGYVTVLVLFFAVGVALWGFRVALAGRPLFRDEILEEAEGVR